MRDLVYLHGDAGIGGGILIDGKPLGRADERVAGIGHMLVNPRRGRLCRCGSRGCLNTELGCDALLAAVGRSPGAAPRDAIRTMVRDAAAGDRTAAATIAAAGDWLGIAIANLITLLSPDMVILDGTLRELYTAAAAQIHTRIAQPARTDLRLAALGENAALLGAAELAFTALLADPLGSIATST